MEELKNYDKNKRIKKGSKKQQLLLITDTVIISFISIVLVSYGRQSTEV